jgi:hypothetical protein
MFAGLQVFRDGTSVSVFAASSFPDRDATGPDRALLEIDGDDSVGDAFEVTSAWCASGGSAASENRLKVDLSVPVWDPLQFEVRTASPSVVEIDVGRDLESRGIQLGSG